MAYTYFSTGDFLAYVHTQQSAWGVQLSNPFSILTRSFLAKDATLAFVGSYTIVGILLLTLYYKKVSVSYRIVGALLIGAPLLGGWVSFASIPRHFLAVFPFYILFAKLSKNIYFDKIASVFLASFQVALMAFWSNGLLIV
ncbi:hypothetical protein IID22_05145 [Patescibacteria group bacterium]|nr:hypothetical protein [Patescibacteria group bacterium]